MIKTFYRQFVRKLLVVLGILSLVLGFIGIFLPLLPTTPFVLLSAFCFSKGSERLHAWIINQPYLGKMIRDWNEHGVIRTKAKIMCGGLIVLTMGYSIGFVAMKPIYRLSMVGVGIAVLSFVLSRPSRPRTAALDSDSASPVII